MKWFSSGSRIFCPFTDKLSTYTHKPTRTHARTQTAHVNTYTQTAESMWFHSVWRHHKIQVDSEVVRIKPCTNIDKMRNVTFVNSDDVAIVVMTSASKLWVGDDISFMPDDTADAALDTESVFFPGWGSALSENRYFKIFVLPVILFVLMFESVFCRSISRLSVHHSVVGLSVLLSVYQCSSYRYSNLIHSQFICTMSL